MRNTPEPSEEQKARARRIHEQVEELKHLESKKAKKKKGKEKSKAPAKSPREFIHERMRELEGEGK